MAHAGYGVGVEGAVSGVRKERLAGHGMIIVTQNRGDAVSGVVVEALG